MKMVRHLGAWLLAGIVLLWRHTCRYSIINDPRPRLRQEQRPYVYALLHAHQIAAVLLNDEPRMAAMVSRSGDGDLLVPSLRVRHVDAVRGSTRSKGRDKGGRQALEQLIALAQQHVPTLIAVDGPKGPRNYVHRGVTTLAQQSGAMILPVILVTPHKWMLRRTWDCMQIPKPFAKITMIFGEPLTCHDIEATRVQVSEELLRLERAHETPQPAS